MICTLMTKHFRFISQSAVFESTLLMATALCGYMLSEMLHLSAICSLLVSSIIYSHYTWYNLSPQGKHVTALTFQTLGYMAEALVFAFIGMSSVGLLMNNYVSWQFILAQLVFVVVARTLGIFISYYAFECCKGSESNRLSPKEIMFAVWAAYIRGAIAFGLTMNLDPQTFNIDAPIDQRENSVEVVQTTLLSLVIITTFFFGGFTPLVKQCLMGKETTIEDMEMTIAQKRAFTVASRSAAQGGHDDLSQKGSRMGSFLAFVMEERAAKIN